MTNKNKILVTGGAGFLGSHLCKRLLNDFDEEVVVCMDNLSTGRVENLSEIQSRNRFEFIQHDVVNPIDEAFDMIWNLACPASPPKYQLDPIHTFKTSVDGADNLAKIAMANDALLFHTSTSEVYGDPEVTPQPEKYWGNVNPVGIRSCYDEGKRAAETLLMDYNRHHGLKLKLARIFNTYGPKMAPDDGRVVSNFITQALSGNDITIYGAGEQTRSFCYVDDLIDVFMLFAKSSEEFTGPLNTGNPNEFQIVELADLVIELTDSKSKIVFEPLPEDDPKQRRPDIQLAKEHLGWQPKVQLKDGLKETIDYFKRTKFA